MNETIDWKEMDEESRSIILSFLQAAFLCQNKGLGEDFFMGFAKESWEWMKRDPNGSHAFWQAAVAHEIKN
jgi:hypothetical protein